MMIKKRFSFGRNWRDFVERVDDSRITLAENSLKAMLNKETLARLRFLDIGCGSGLFSLAAIRLGATEVVSFDYDADSVSCAKELNKRYGPFDNWNIMGGDALDLEFLYRLGEFDIVYSWGVLHHSGNMWKGLQNIITAVRPGGLLYVAIYNDQGVVSHCWRFIKRLYISSPRPAQFAIVVSWYSIVLLARTIYGVVGLRPLNKWYLRSERGMSLWHDTIDWVGGYPFETASVERLFRFYHHRGFNLTNMKLKSGSGCNELLMLREQHATMRPYMTDDFFNEHTYSRQANQST
jgi:SAM-dependent methyltransferase